MLTWIKRKRGQKGFTLIELIVVITILGILALIAIPRLGAFRAQAEAKALESNRRIARGAAAMWLAEHGNPVGGPEVWTPADPGDSLEYLESFPSGVTNVTIDTDGTITVDGESGGTPPGGTTSPAYLADFTVTGTGASLAGSFVAPPATSSPAYTVNVPYQLPTPTTYVASYVVKVPAGATVTWSTGTGPDNARTIDASVASYTVTVDGGVSYTPTVYTFTNQQAGAPTPAYLADFTVTGTGASLAGSFVAPPVVSDPAYTVNVPYQVPTTTYLASYTATVPTGATVVWSTGSGPDNSRTIDASVASYTVTVSATDYVTTVYTFTNQQAAAPVLVTETFTTSGSWTAPAGVTQITIHLIGGGGGTESPSDTRAGAGGGAYSRVTTFAVTPGNSYSYVVGAGGANHDHGNDSHYNGGNSYWVSAGTALAVGGAGNTGGDSGSLGGQASVGVGDVKYNGGNGGERDNEGGEWHGGGGGGGAGSTGAGANASHATAGGATSANGGAGGAGRTTNGDAFDGNTYGGGAGGAMDTASGTRTGGTGASGVIWITYYVIP